ncbi:MAG: sigma-54-dependent Fis family transcriptional regulator [Acidobacteriaceae bacterium]|nr:sigma-54-dependent Fis family transcriptional regulator [Acidobacteriaceae bacterium]
MATRIIIIGAGRGGRVLVELFHKDPTIEIAGVADKDEGAPGIVLARELGLRVTANYRELLTAEAADLVIDVTGDPGLAREIYRLKPEGTEVVGGNTARFITEFAGNRNKEFLEDRYQLALRELEGRADSEFIIGNNPKMKEISGLIAKVAPTPTTVMIRGESGTGKELVARAIHRHSTRSNQPLVTLNCTALSPALLESELFGYKRGAFTGAYTDSKGLFEKASGGTMFLDEIGDMSLEIQAKLLRTLQTGEIRAVGDIHTRTVSVRIICATNRNLETAIREGSFREDLFYRINTFSITLPPLRERIEDIPFLAEYFLQRARAKVNKRVESISQEALAMLKNYSWPGNLRELENIIERAVVLTLSSAIEPEHLPLHVQDIVSFNPTRGFKPSKAEAIGHFERDALSSYLLEAGGNVSRAAKLAKIPRRTFHRLMAKHKIVARPS